MLTGCLRCHKDPYEPRIEHPHYCDDCVQKCVSCGELRTLDLFPFDEETEAYRLWAASIKTGHKGISTRDTHLPTCQACTPVRRRQTRQPSRPKRSKEPINVEKLTTEGWF